MTRMIECSHEEAVDCDVRLSFLGKLRFGIAMGRFGWTIKKYEEKDIATITTIDEEQYRSAGGAAAGAVIGGVLTGGIGLLAGAAIGGRRKRSGAYLVTFTDGSHVAFEEKSSQVLRAIQRKVEVGKVRSLLADRDASA